MVRSEENLPEERKDEGQMQKRWRLEKIPDTQLRKNISSLDVISVPRNSPQQGGISKYLPEELMFNRAFLLHSIGRENNSDTRS